MWNVGKFGDLRPYAVLEPVAVGGVTIKLATLHNEEDIVRKDIRAGEDVIVLRAGDVIPQVDLARRPHVVEHAIARRRRARPRAARSATPRRSSREDAVFTKCPNRDCPARAWQLLKHFVSRGAMDIDGLGEKQVALLQEHGLVQHGRRLLPADRGAAARARGLRRALGAQPARGDRGLQAAAVRARAVRARDRGGRRGHRPQPGPALPRHRRAAGGHARGDRARPRASARRWPTRSTPSCTTSACAR